jgi:hypothetical protein
MPGVWLPASLVEWNIPHGDGDSEKAERCQIYITGLIDSNRANNSSLMLSESGNVVDDSTDGWFLHSII